MGGRARFRSQCSWTNHSCWKSTQQYPAVQDMYKSFALSPALIMLPFALLKAEQSRALRQPALAERLPSLWHFPSASHRQGAEVHSQAAELILPRTDEFVHSMDLESGMELKTNPLEKSPPPPTVRTLRGEPRTLRVHSMHCTVENSPGAGSEWALGGH